MTALLPVLQAGRAIRRAFCEQRLLGLLWLIESLVAMLAVVPGALIVAASFSRSLVGRGHPFVSSEVIALLRDLVAEHGMILAGSAFPALVLGLAVSPILSGGVLCRMRAGGSFDLPAFLSDSLRFFWRNLRLQAWAMLGLGLVGALLSLWSRLIGKRLAEGLWEAACERERLAFNLVAILLFVAWRTTFDIARALVVTGEMRKTRVAAWQALKLCLCRPGILLGYSALGLAGLAVVLAMAALHFLLPVKTVLGALLALIVGQAALLLRLGFWVAAGAYALEVVVAAPPPEAQP